MNTLKGMRIKQDDTLTRWKDIEKKLIKKKKEVHADIGELVQGKLGISTLKAGLFYSAEINLEV